MTDTEQFLRQWNDWTVTAFASRSWHESALAMANIIGILGWRLDKIPRTQGSALAKEKLADAELLLRDYGYELLDAIRAERLRRKLAAEQAMGELGSDDGDE